MKKNIILIISSVFLITSLSGCKGGSTDPVITLEKQTVFYEDLDSPGLSIESNVCFAKENPYVVYIPIISYQEYIPSFTMSIKQNGNQFIFTNLLNYSKAYLDADSGVITYDAFSKFTSGDSIPHQEIDFSTLSKKVEEESSYTKGVSYSINLSDYNLKPVKYEDTYYLPADVLMRIDPLSMKGTLYYDGEDTITLMDDSNMSNYAGYMVSNYPNTFYNYCYDLFTFDIDYLFGLNGFNRYQRNSNSNFVFNKDGARKTFEKYKESLISSTTTKDFDIKLDEIIANELDDGGHTIVCGSSLATNKEELPEEFKTRSKHKEYSYILDRMDKEKKAKLESSQEQKIDEFVTGFDTDNDDKIDIGYVRLEEFTAGTTSKSEIRTLLVNANYYFNRNNKYPNSNPDSEYIKDVVIDLSCNGGGSTACEGYLLSWLCGGKGKQILKDARDKSITTSVYKYNINMDKDGNNQPIFDEQDYLPSDVNIYILTDATYSAACALAFDTYMYSLSDEAKALNKNIKFIGKPNLGGSCSVTNNMITPTGFSYRLSSNAVGINWYDQSKTCDEVMPISAGFEDMDEYDIVNRTGFINPKIVSQRSK